jgi:hypothetical protein
MFELHNCDDRNCYLDLTRLTGHTYMTWRPQDEYSVTNKTAHAKFTDYTLNADAFEQRLRDAIDALKRRRFAGEDIVEVF